MKNLAGDENCDTDIVEELKNCGIEIVRLENKTNSEVPFTITGKLGSLTFERAWYYWVVTGKVPLSVAEELYANPIGKKVIRVQGHCGCPAPTGSYVEWFTDDDKPIASLADKADFEKWATQGHTYMIEKMKQYVFTDDPQSISKPYVTTYHIDSAEGLKLFADTMKRYIVLQYSA